MKHPAASAPTPLSRLSALLPQHGYWALPALIALLIMAGSLSADSFFMHLDTSTLHQNAADLTLGGCWGPSGKPLVTLILAIPYRIFGPDPAWELLIETLLAVIQISAFARLTFRLTGSRRWALLASLYFLSLPFVLFFMRMHLAFPLTFFTIGLLLHVEGKHMWAGIFFGLTPLSHAAFLIQISAWLGLTFLLALREDAKQAFRSYIRIAIGMACSILAFEFIHFLYMGQPLAWSRGLFAVVDRHSSRSSPTDWRQALAIVQAGDGWINMIVLFGASLAYPLFRRRDQRHLDGLFLAVWSVLAAFAVWTGVFHRQLIPHLITGLYPMITIVAAVSVKRALTALPRHPIQARLITGIMALGVALALPYHTLNAAAGSHTAYPEIRAQMTRAAEEGRPVRYFGNFHVGFFYGLTEGVPTGINEVQTEAITHDTQAVLIFENEVDGNNSVLDALLADPAFDIDAYDQTVIPGHFTIWKPYHADDGRHGTQTLLNIARGPNVRSPGAPTGTVTVLWPRQPSGEFIARHEVPELVYFYPGEGCVTPRRFGDQNYYHILGEKAVILWDELRAGRIGEIFRLLWLWISEY